MKAKPTTACRAEGKRPFPGPFPRPRPWLFKLASAAFALLLFKVFVFILIEYPRYFPPDFESNYLAGRRYSFEGEFRTAFYVHILSSPIALMMGLGLMLSGPTLLDPGRVNWRKWHRWTGRAQAALVFLVVAPSGMVMAKYAYAGPIASAGFICLNIATVACLSFAIWHAKAGRIMLHRRFATRCFLLLCTPLLLRVFAGAIIVLEYESNWSYRLNAWLSWLIPWLIYEICIRSKKRSTWTEASERRLKSF